MDVILFLTILSFMIWIIPIDGFVFLLTLSDNGYSVKWHARLGHYGQNRIIRLARN